jgi:hypothetical protein
MALSVAVIAKEQSARRLRQELQPDQERHRPMKKAWSFLWRQIGDGLEIQRDRLLKPAEYLVKGSALDRNVEIEAERLPITVPALGAAMQSSGRQRQTSSDIVSGGSPPAQHENVRREPGARNFPARSRSFGPPVPGLNSAPA